MIQPFEKFLPAYIERLIRLNKNYLVSQTYSRAANHPTNTTAILLSDYDDKGEAQLHHKAVRHDRYAAIINLKEKAHQNKLIEMLDAHSAYEIYWAVMKDKAAIKQQLDQQYKEHIKKFIAKNTQWRITSGERVHTILQVTFGDLFIIIKKGTQTLRVKFEEIENQ